MSNDLTGNENSIMRAVIEVLEEIPISSEAVKVEAIRQRARDMTKVAFRIALKRLMGRGMLQESDYAEQPTVYVTAAGWRCVEKIYEEK